MHCPDHRGEANWLDFHQLHGGRIPPFSGGHGTDKSLIEGFLLPADQALAFSEGSALLPWRPCLKASATFRNEVRCREDAARFQIYSVAPRISLR